MSHNVIELSVVAYGLKNTKNNFKKHFEIKKQLVDWRRF
jgi:hypothetical protein